MIIAFFSAFKVTVNKVHGIKHTFCLNKRPFPFPAWSTNPTSDPKGEKSCPIHSTWSQQITLSKPKRPNTEFTKSTVSHRLSECVRAWLPSGFKPKVTFFFFVSHGLTGQTRTSFAALTEITNTPAPKVIIFKVCSVLSKLHLSYISSEHTYTQCETTQNCAHCCLSWFTLNAPRGRTEEAH